MTPLARLNARITELQSARAELQSALDGLESAPPPPPAQDWETRLSAARAVDSLTGAATAQAVEVQRQADVAAREKQARQAIQNAARVTQTREAINALTRDCEAAQSLLQRELASAAGERLPDFERDYHRARAAMQDAAETLAGCLALSSQQTAAAQLLRSVGSAGDALSLMNRRANELREQLINEEETDHA